MRSWVLLAALLLVSCAKLMPDADSGEDIEVTIYGVGGKPMAPPDTCKRLEAIEVTRLENKDPPIDKLEREARDRDANAVAYVRRRGFKDGYLGKEYTFTAAVYRCPFAKPPASAAPAPAASAAPTASP